MYQIGKRWAKVGIASAVCAIGSMIGGDLLSTATEPMRIDDPQEIGLALAVLFITIAAFAAGIVNGLAYKEGVKNDQP